MTRGETCGPWLDRTEPRVRAGDLARLSAWLELREGPRVVGDVYLRLWPPLLARPAGYAGDVLSLVLSNVVVRPRQRRRGHFARLLEMLEHTAGARGWDLYLENVVNAHLGAYLARRTDYTPIARPGCYRYVGSGLGALSLRLG